MSVVIIVKVSEGLVLGADSASTLQGNLLGPDKKTQQVTLKTFMNARKLLQIGDFPIGVLNWGSAYIGARTIDSLIREWEHDAYWQSREAYYKNGDGAKEQYQVKTCAEGLLRHISGKYTEEFRNSGTQEKPIVGIIVAGYSDKAFFPEIWRFVLPFDLNKEIHDQRPDIDGKPNFGATWYGMTDAIVRLHFGRDDRLIKLLTEKYGIDEKEILEILKPFEYQIPFGVMPLQDAIEYAHYMLSVTLGRFRFVLGAELCGGDIDIAAITQKKFDWISKKTLSIGGRK